jgi:site-specific DNA-methyltransferase (adenine-specific)
MGDLTGDYAPSHEFIIFAARTGHKLRGKRIGNVWTIPRDSNDAYLHPTQKPVAFFSRMIEKSSDPGMMVLDPFMCSGTSLVAAKRLGRCAIGCETERKYCDVAIKRLEQTGTSLLVDIPRKDRGERLNGLDQG